MPGAAGKMWAGESCGVRSGFLTVQPLVNPCSSSAHPTPVMAAPSQGGITPGPDGGGLDAETVNWLSLTLKAALKCHSAFEPDT